MHRSPKYVLPAPNFASRAEHINVSSTRVSGSLIARGGPAALRNAPSLHCVCIISKGINMKLRMIALTGAALVSLSGGPAAAGEGLYLGLEAGYSIPEDVNWKFSGLPATGGRFDFNS